MLARRFSSNLASHVPALQSLAASDPSSILTSSSETSRYTRCWMDKYGHTDSGSVVLRPSSLMSLKQFLQYSNDHKLPVVTQSGNTSLVGSASPQSTEELVLSLDRFPSDLTLDEEEGVMILDAGVTLSDAIDLAQTRGFVFPVDLGAKGSCKIGGNVATNAGGIYFNRFGSMKSNVLGLEVVLPSGEVIDMMRCMLPKDSTGFDLKSLFIGSEGCLGVITKVAMKVHRKPTSSDLCVFNCPDFDAVRTLTHRLQQTLGNITSAVEIMDAGILNLIETKLEKKIPWNLNSPYYVLVETMGFHPQQDRQALESFFSQSFEDNLVVDGVLTQTQSQQLEIWSVRESCGPAVNSAEQSWKYDLSLELKHWDGFVKSVQETIGDDGRVVLWGHLGDRNIHLNVVSDLPDVNLADKIEPGLYDSVIRAKGSISAEHGVGLAKAKHMPNVVGEAVLNRMRDIKRVFDPNGIMNPGKMIA